MKSIYILLFILPVFALAQDLDQFGIDTTKYVPTGLKIGDTAPFIKTTSIDGSVINSLEILKNKEIVVLFYRGQWCPVCNKYLSNLTDSLELIKSKAVVIVIGPEKVENAQKESDLHENAYTIIADTNLVYLKSFDVLFGVTEKYDKKIKTFLRTSIAENNGAEGADLPVPATFIIGKDGVIKYRQFDYNYKIRATAKEILDHLE